MTSSAYSATAVDCYSTNGDIPSFANSSYLAGYGVNSCETGSSFNLPLTLTTQQLGASVASVVAGSGTSLSLSMKASPPSAGDITAGSGELDYAQIFAAQPGSTINLPMSATALGDASASVVASSDSDCATTNCTAYASTSGPGAHQSLNVGPLTVGPSGQYTLTATLSAGVESPGGLPANSSVTLNFCPMNVTLFSNGMPRLSAYATVPANGSLSAAAKACGYQGFNWQQIVTDGACPDTVVAVNTGGVVSANLCPGGVGMAAGPEGKNAPSFNDPPPGGGYTYLTYATGAPYDTSPYYFPMLQGTQVDVPLALLVNGHLVNATVNHADAALLFVDTPANICLPTGPVSPANLIKCGGQTAAVGSNMGFTGNLVGVNQSDGSPSPPLFTWTYTSNYNGTVGGTSVFSGFLPPDPGSGVGNVTITSINGVPVPPIIPPTQVSTTASGLAYSRVTRTFDGTVTITNTSGTTLTTPTSFQLVLNSLPSGVTLTNSMGTFNNCPYITIPTLTSMVPGQSVTVAVQFSNPSDATINFTPEFYAGSFQ